MRYFPVLFLLATICSQAEDLYFSQAGAGAADGSSVANAWSLSAANTAGNWGSGAGKISAGDTLHVSGTVTQQLIIQASGTAGSPITILFENGAKFSAPRWSTGGSEVFVSSSGAILANGKSYIHIDGSNSVNAVGIEATHTGTGLTYDDYNIGVLFYNSGDGLVVRNLTVTNMYRRTPGSAESKQNGNPIAFRGGVYRSITVSNCAVWQANIGIYVGAASGVSTNILIIDTRGGDCAEGVFVHGSESVTSQTRDVILHNVDFRDQATWSGDPATHCNFIHAHSTVNGNSGLTDLTVRSSKFHGTCSSAMTSFIFFEGYLTNVLIYNNLFVIGDANFGGNGLITLKGAKGAKVLNNTIIGTNSTGVGVGTTSFGASQDAGHTISNNVFVNLNVGIYDAVPSTTASDYNTFTPGTQMLYISGLDTFGGWKTETGYDANSNTNGVQLTASYELSASDSAARNTGSASPSASFATDKIGVVRPQGLAWDMGAFEYQDTAPTPNVPRIHNGFRGLRGF